MAKLVISREAWDELEHANDSCRAKGCKQHLSAKPFTLDDVKFVSEKEYAAILAEMFKVVGTAPKKEESKGKGGKKQKDEKEDEE